MKNSGKMTSSHAVKGTKIVVGAPAIKAGTSGGKTRNGGGQNGKCKC